MFKPCPCCFVMLLHSHIVCGPHFIILMTCSNPKWVYTIRIVFLWMNEYSSCPLFLLLTHFWIVTENGGWIFIDALQRLELSPFSSGWSILCSLAVWSPKAIPFTGLITSAARCDKSWLKLHHFCCLCPWQGDTDDAVRRRRTPLGIVWCRVSMFSSPARHPLQPCPAIFCTKFPVWPAVKESHIDSVTRRLYIEAGVPNRCWRLIVTSCLISRAQLPVY